MSLFEESQVDQYDENHNLIARVCGCCGELKPISEFYKNGRGPSGRPRYRRDCKTCYARANEGRTQSYRDKKWQELYGVTEEDIEEMKK